MSRRNARRVCFPILHLCESVKSVDKILNPSISRLSLLLSLTQVRIIRFPTSNS